MKALQFAVALLATVASSGLNAQTMDIRMNIPFDFRMGEKLMPAGEYLIHHTSGVLTVSEQGGSRVNAVTLTNATNRWQQSDKAVLQFNKYGNDYFLGKISVPDSDIARLLPRSAREKELARRLGPAQQTIVAVQTK